MKGRKIKNLHDKFKYNTTFYSVHFCWFIKWFDADLMWPIWSDFFPPPPQWTYLDANMLSRLWWSMKMFLFPLLPLVVLFLILHLSEKPQLPLTCRHSTIASARDHVVWNTSACTCVCYSCAHITGMILSVEIQLFLSLAWKLWLYFSCRSSEGERGGRWRIGLSCESVGCDECCARLHLLSVHPNTIFHFHYWIKVSVCAAEWLLCPSGEETGTPRWWKPGRSCSVVGLLLIFLLMGNN